MKSLSSYGNLIESIKVVYSLFGWEILDFFSQNINILQIAIQVIDILVFTNLEYTL